MKDDKQPPKVFVLNVKGNFGYDGKKITDGTFSYGGCQTCRGEFNISIPFTVPSAGELKSIVTVGEEQKGTTKAGHDTHKLTAQPVDPKKLI